MAKTRRTQPKRFSDQLREAIEHCGQSRYAISRATGVSDAALCRFMQGKQGLLLDTIDILVEHLDLRLTSSSETEGE